MDWGLVLIFSLGQTRWFRIRRKEGDNQYYNIEMKHNSVLLMHGETFQQLYTHQVDKLSKSDAMYYRLSLNIRFLEGENNLPELF
jgi:alkylated DNA repair dioxygenase AlkB